MRRSTTPSRALQHGGFDSGRESAFAAESEGGADLHAGRAGGFRGAQRVRRGLRTGEPEREAERANGREVRRVARAVDWFAPLVELLPAAARRGVVAAGSRAFDDETVDLAAGFAGERERERRGGNDREKSRACERSLFVGQHGGGIELHALLGRGAFDRDAQLRFLARRKAVEDAGNRLRNARAHQHVVDPGQHRAVEGGERGQLNFLEQIDPDGAGVIFLRKVNFDEVRRGGEAEQFGG